MKKHLISIIAFVLEQITIFNLIVCEDRFELENHITLKTNIEKYANFLFKNLEIWQFVPCKFVDGVWVVLEEPGNFELWLEMHETEGGTIVFDEHVEYWKAKDRCYFEGFEIKYYNTHKSIKLKDVDFNVFWNKGCNLGWYPSIGIKNIESISKYNLELTPTGAKESGLI